MLAQIVRRGTNQVADVFDEQEIQVAASCNFGNARSTNGISRWHAPPVVICTVGANGAQPLGVAIGFHVADQHADRM